MGGFSITGPLQNMIGSGAFRTESQRKEVNDGLAGGSFWRNAGVGSTTYGFSLSYYDPAHAVGPYIKPYSVKSLYLISY